MYLFLDVGSATEGGVDDEERVGADDAGGHHPLPGQEKVCMYVHMHKHGCPTQEI